MFSLQKNQVIDQQITDPPVAKKQRKDEEEVGDDEDDIEESVIDTLPENHKVNAKKIVFYVRMVTTLYHGQQMGM